MSGFGRGGREGGRANEGDGGRGKDGEGGNQRELRQGRSGKEKQWAGRGRAMERRGLS